MTPDCALSMGVIHVQLVRTQALEDIESRLEFKLKNRNDN